MLDDATFSIFFFGFLGLMLVTLLICVVLYVLSALGSRYVLKTLGHPSPWMAWIPLLETVALASCCEEEDNQVYVLNQPIPMNLFVLWPVLVIVCTFIPVVGTLLCLAINVLAGGSMYAILYAKMEGKTRQECATLGYVSALICLIPVVKFLIYRHHGKYTDTL